MKYPYSLYSRENYFTASNYLVVEINRLAGGIDFEGNLLSDVRRARTGLLQVNKITGRRI
jgi:hypothetical protein